MADVAVSDASPVIVLARAGWLELLRVVAEWVVLPSEVVAEIQRHGRNDAAGLAVTTTAWLVIITVGSVDPRV